MSKATPPDGQWFSGRVSNVLFYKVSLLHARYSKIVAAEAARGGLTLPQFKVLSVIGSFGPLPAAKVSASLTMDQAAVSRMVRQLLDLDLITRRLSDSDGRVVALALSKAGARLYGQIAARLDTAQEQMLQDLDPGQRHVLFGMFDALLSTHQSFEHEQENADA